MHRELSGAHKPGSLRSAQVTRAVDQWGQSNKHAGTRMKWTYKQRESSNIFMSEPNLDPL